MKTLAGGLLLWLVCMVPLAGQDRDRSLERIAIALQQPHPVMRGIDRIETTETTQFGMFTLVQPQLPGEIVRVSVPIGELISWAFKSVAAAKRQRQEEAARREVEAALKWFAVQQPPPHR